MLIHTQTQCMILRTACILAAITQITAKMCISVNYLNLLLGDLKFHRVNSHIRCMNWMHFRLTCSRSFRSLHMHNMFFFFFNLFYFTVSSLFAVVIVCVYRYCRSSDSVLSNAFYECWNCGFLFRFLRQKMLEIGVVYIF